MIVRKRWGMNIFVVSPIFAPPARQKAGRDMNAEKHFSALIVKKRSPKIISTNRPQNNIESLLKFNAKRHAYLLSMPFLFILRIFTSRIHFNHCTPAVLFQKVAMPYEAFSAPPSNPEKFFLHFQYLPCVKGYLSVEIGYKKQISSFSASQKYEKNKIASKASPFASPS